MKTSNLVVHLLVNKCSLCLTYSYFDDDEDKSQLEYIPAPGSPSYKPQNKEDSDSEEDPLDAFMAGIEKEVKKDTRKEKVEVPKKELEKGVRGDIDNEDDEESYYRLIN